MTGYTPTQAESLHHKIDREVAKAEDAVSELRVLVPDDELHAVVDRRRRP